MSSSDVPSASSSEKCNAREESEDPKENRHLMVALL